MSLCKVRFYSVYLDKWEQMNVIVPPGKGPYPVLYLLHGLSDDHEAWTVNSRIEQYAERKRLIIAMPNVGRMFYVNDPRPGGQKCEDYIMRDVIGTVDRMFHTIAARRARAVAGLSMGGYGAMMLALRNPEKFCASVSHSGALYFADPKAMLSDHPDVNQLSIACQQAGYDLEKLARKFKKAGRKLALRLDCGEDDFLIESSRRFDAYLDKLEIAHEYQEHSGVHNWDYWNEHVPQTLAFVLKHLKRK